MRRPARPRSTGGGAGPEKAAGLPSVSDCACAEHLAVEEGHAFVLRAGSARSRWRGGGRPLRRRGRAAEATVGEGSSGRFGRLLEKSAARWAGPPLYKTGAEGGAPVASVSWCGASRLVRVHSATVSAIARRTWRGLGSGAAACWRGGTAIRAPSARGGGRPWLLRTLGPRRPLSTPRTRDAAMAAEEERRRRVGRGESERWALTGAAEARAGEGGAIAAGWGRVAVRNGVRGAARVRTSSRRRAHAPRNYRILK